jgi:acyl-CoA synthetase (NDP forming)
VRERDVLEEFRPLFRPRSVAVVGATNNPFKLGYHALAAVRSAGFEGEVYPVHPREEEVQGLKAYPSVEALPEGVELYIFAVPGPAAVEEAGKAARRGARAGVIFAGGFREMGAEGERLQRELARRADEAGMKVVGPNCIGVLNPSGKLNATFAFPLSWFPPGDVAVVSQSGGMGNVILNHMLDERVGLSKFVSLGNRANLDFHHVLEYLAEDPETAVICLFVEGLDHGREFLEKASLAASRKPVLVYSRGYSGKASRAALSHTGASASSEEIYRGAFRQAGVLAVDSAEELVCAAKALSLGAVPRGEGLFLCTHTAGPAIALAEICERGGLRFPDLRAELASAMEEFLPPGAAPGNPLDAFAFAWTDPSIYLRAVDLALSQEDVHAAVAVFASGAASGIRFPFREYARLGKEHGKPVYLCVLTPFLTPGELDQAREEGIPTYNTPEKAGKALVRAAEYHRLSRDRASR